MQMPMLSNRHTHRKRDGKKAAPRPGHVPAMRQWAQRYAWALSGLWNLVAAAADQMAE